MSFSASSTADGRRMTVHDFRIFQAGRPDRERWELIDGVPVMMTPAIIGHARIAGNIERLLMDALELHDPSRVALQAIGIALGLDGNVLPRLGKGENYAPEPDVAVIADDPEPGLRFAPRLFVAVEVVSGTDLTSAARGIRWIDAKTAIYRAHRFCEAIVVIEQDRVEVRVSRRSETGWIEDVLRDVDDALTLPTCGLRCTVGEVYAGTHLRPRSARRPMA